MTAAWDLFVASIDPVKLERERTGHPRWSERPGSAADRMMRIKCQAEAERFARLKRERDKRLLVAEVQVGKRAIARREAAVKHAPVVPLSPRDRLQLAVDRDRRVS